MTQTAATIAIATVTAAMRLAHPAPPRTSTIAHATHVTDWSAWPDGYAESAVSTSEPGGRGRS